VRSNQNEFGIVVEKFGLPRPELDSWYSFSVCGLENGAVRATGGITITPQGSLSELQHADTIIIPGWRKPIRHRQSRSSMPCLKRMHAVRV